MIDNYTEEHYAVIGDSSERLVAEGVYWLTQQSDTDVTPPDVVNAMVTELGIDPDDARDRVQKGMAAGDVGCEHVPGKPTILHCRWMDTQRMRRRMWFWTLDEQGEHFPGHLPGECMVVRAAVADCLDERDEATWNHLMEMVQWLAGYDDERLALHAMLNALDAGAITVAMWHGEKPVSIVTDWHQGLES